METLAKPYSAKISVKMKEPVAVLHIIKSLGRGGAEILLPETLSKHNKNKYRFHYIYFLPWKNQMVAQLEKEGGKVTCLSAKNNVEILCRVFQIAAYLKEHNIKLIHCHLPWAGIVGRIAGKMANIRVIYTEHCTWEIYNKLTRFFNKLSFSRQEKVIAVSADVAKSIKTNYGKSKPNVQVILNGINTEKFSNHITFSKDIKSELNIAANSIVIGTICVFRLQKRLDIWLQIAKDIHALLPSTFFIIVGDGQLKNEIQTKASEIGMKNYIHFAGLQTEIRPYLKAIDIFMMTSEFEGLPIALLEAMSMGCLPACTNAGGIADLIEDNVNGIVVPAADPMQLIDRLTECMQSPVKIMSMKKAARKTVTENFSLEKMVDELETIYDNVLN